MVVVSVIVPSIIIIGLALWMAWKAFDRIRVKIGASAAVEEKSWDEFATASLRRQLSPSQQFPYEGFNQYGERMARIDYSLSSLKRLRQP